MADVIFAIEAYSVSATRLDVSAREFTFTVDEPTKLGGSNAGPNPVEYLLGALAGCINVVGYLVAKEMGFSIEELAIHIEGPLDALAFSGKKPGVRPGYQEIRVRCDVRTLADDETLARWMQSVVARCPVSDNIEHATPLRMSVQSW